MRRAALMTAPVVLAMAGCMVGPDYERPDLSAQVGDAWIGPGSAGVEEIASWWTRLGDAELTGLIERALSSNLDLVEARERIIAARARRGIENAESLPTLDAEASYSRLGTGDQGFNLNGPPAGNSTDLYSLGVVAGWELDLWGRVGRLVEAADADIAFALEDFRAARVALAAEVAREVVTVRSLDLELKIVRATIATDEDNREITDARARAGLADALDASRALRTLRANEAVLPDLEGRRRDSELRLAVLLGERPGTVTVTGVGLPRRDVLPAMGVPADLLTRRPDVRRAEQALVRANARIGAAKAEWYPRVSVSGTLALQGPQLGDAFEPDAHAFRLGPSISVPLFEGGRIESSVRVRESEQRQAVAALRRSVLDAMREVESAAMLRERTEERVQRLADAVDSARDTETLSEDRYGAGAVDFLDVAEARSQRLVIEREREIARREAVFRLIDLYAALGGGWGAGEDAVGEAS